MKPASNIAIAAYGLLIPYEGGLHKSFDNGYGQGWSPTDGTVFGYTMWNTGGFPVALKRTFVVPSSKYPIRVKIIKVDRARLNHIDIMEDTPYMYKRELEDVHMDNGEKTKAWFYVGTEAFWKHRPLQPEIKDGDWLKFQKERYDRVMNPPVEQQ
jgi:gamma-glutamylcyclotransferase (GGCT)/AIG2-like uncharacterized protein YtfP